MSALPVDTVLADTLLSDERVILVLDSGIGGLSVLAEIGKVSPSCRFLYLADNACLPYGDKSEGWLIQRVDWLVRAVSERYRVAMLVIACNTASTVVLSSLRQYLTVPVVGVVPAIKPAAMLSGSGHIGLLATPGTVRRAYTHRLINDYAAHCQVTCAGSVELVRLAEHKLSGGVVCAEQLHSALEPLFSFSDLDTIILGCTHFPWLRAELEAIAPREIHWVDSGQAVAHRVASLLSDVSGLSSDRVRNEPLFLPVNTHALTQVKVLFTGSVMPLQLPADAGLSLQAAEHFPV